MIRLDALSPTDALASLKRRGEKLDPTFDWTEFWQEDHARAFTVAKSAGFDILQDIFSALQTAVDGGGSTPKDFSRTLRPVLEQKGWWGKKTVIDPATGRPRYVQLGSERRLKTIFEANMRVSYAAGHWASFQRNKLDRPWLRYVALEDGRTRPHHLALHNLVLPVDHPFWNTHAPPNGWGCRCTLQSLSDRDLQRLKDSGVALVFEPPVITTRKWVNRRTGEITYVPDGIDPGWDYNPGQSGYRAALEKGLAEKEANPEGWLNLQPSRLQWPAPARTAMEAERLTARLDAGQEDWRQTLTHQEELALESYKGTGHEDVNKVLRGLGEELDGFDIEAANELALELSTALERARLPEPVTVFRGLPGRVIDELGVIEPGETLSDPGYLSASLLELASNSFGAMILEIRIPKGARAIALIHSIPEVHHVEYEMLLDRGYRLQVIGRTRNRILLEAIPDDA